MDAFIKFLADGLLLFILAAGGASIVWDIRKRLWSVLPALVMAGLSSLLVGKLMSLIYQPETMRPFEKLGLQAGAAYIDNPGFPSDHALLATVVVLAVYVLCRRNWLAYLLSALVVAMCAARVMALVHTPLDVIFGVIAGLSGGIWYKKLTN